MGQLFGKKHNKNCCCGGVCEYACCPGFNIEDANLDNTGYEPGGLGCPDVTACLGIGCDNGMRMAVSSPTDPTWLDLFAGYNICAVFHSVGLHSIPGLIGFFEVEAVVACIDSGGAYKAFVRYGASVNPALIPEDVWIETTAGWECPDCETLGPGFAYATLWWDAFVDCTVCNGAAFNYGPPDYCSPDSIFSIRYRFRGGGTCA